MVCVCGGVVLVFMGCAMSVYVSLNTGKQIASSFFFDSVGGGAWPRG